MLFRQAHQQIRDELAGLPDDAVNWLPAPGTNSTATIVTHLVGSEAETLQCVAGVTREWDRDAEFRDPTRTTREVLGLLDEADALQVELEPRIEESRLTAEFPLPTLPADEV